MDHLTGPLDEVFRDLKKKWRDMQEEEPLWDIIMGFIHAVDWTENWIRIILSCQLVLFILSLSTRRRSIIQGLIFFFSAMVIFLAETLNNLGSKYWPLFSKQDYFDPRGVFLTAVVSGPLVLDMLVVLVNYLLMCAALLVKAKRQELIQKVRQNKKKVVSDGERVKIE
ncbi:hypothetical protein CEUSTIGMA_g11252.t1 [Chlamydomonas eustigma]|uniref:Uncharacterized protein n=1 Tax=Chlamydomonas eustigma TaxID=1157962 RepID=A0A250XL70_9CHLO|nr:hypothetical protein CEUSTIGMA_g11252.t1 [Chlamydomonas eustigma]|eukprot:GAX83828.1 hypothetical protein CEUSTIGMA_g11252.t1 [Chlamydomonas eustigma]